MTHLIHLYYAFINRWIGHDPVEVRSTLIRGKNIGRVFFALPIAWAVFDAGISVSVLSGALVYFTRNLPHGRNYSIGQGNITSGFYMDFAYMAGKGAAIFAPLALVSLPAFFVGALGWPIAYVIGWSFNKGDAATHQAELAGGAVAASSVLIALDVPFGIINLF